MERWYVVGEHSAEEAVASSRHIAVAVVEEVAGIRRIVVAAEDRHSFHTEVEVERSSNRHILAEVDWSGSVTVGFQSAGRRLLTDIAGEDTLHTAAVVGEALGCSLPGYGSLVPGSPTCLRNDLEVECALS
jgi:hypothetical protein